MGKDTTEARATARGDQAIAYLAELVAIPGWVDLLLDERDPAMVAVLRIIVTLNRASIEENMAWLCASQTNPAVLNRLWTYGDTPEQ